MSSQTLTELLEDRAGMEEFHLVLPYPLLPPRYRNQAQNRNMLLVLDKNMTLSTRWEGERLHAYLPLTPRATARLIQEILTRMTSYRRELQSFSTFIQRWAELPFDPDRNDDSPQKSKEKGTKQQGDPLEVVASLFKPSGPLCQLELLLSNLAGGAGGENPMPMGGFDE